MENEIYTQLLAKQKILKADIKAEMEKLYGVELNVDVKININGIPNDMMPEGSKVMKTDNYQWLHYSEGIYDPNLYGNMRKFRIVFDDEPESSNQQPRLTDAVEQAVTSIQP